MKKTILATILCACAVLCGGEEVRFTFPGGKFGKGPGIKLTENTIAFSPVSRMYINEKFDPDCGSLEFTAKFTPVPAPDGRKRMHYLWSAKGNKRTIASAVIVEQGGGYSLNFTAFDENKKPVACSCAVKLPAEKSVTLAFFWGAGNISIKVNGILFAKKNYRGRLLPGESFMFGTSSADRALIPMTVEKIRLTGEKKK
ncbi:MAG: hypothetical protein IJU70_06500 [Lentisphaeria bacterium]|nr:hypothetical protein [Lentisphaeria bacterium]